MGYEDLLEILREGQEELAAEAMRAPTACPNDGTPLKSGRDGVLYCPFDGWRWTG